MGYMQTSRMNCCLNCMRILLGLKPSQFLVMFTLQNAFFSVHWALYLRLYVFLFLDINGHRIGLALHLALPVFAGLAGYFFIKQSRQTLSAQRLASGCWPVSSIAVVIGNLLQCNFRHIRAPGTRIFNALKSLSALKEEMISLEPVCVRVGNMRPIMYSLICIL